MRVRQDEDNGEVAARPSLPPERQVTKHIVQTWTLHKQMLQNPPSDRMRDVHMLHHTQSVSMLDETSVLHGDMPQRNDEEGDRSLLSAMCSGSTGTIRTSVVRFYSALSIFIRLGFYEEKKPR